MSPGPDTRKSKLTEPDQLCDYILYTIIIVMIIHSILDFQFFNNEIPKVSSSADTDSNSEHIGGIG